MILAITNQKGGCAKTTTAINLASSLAAMGHRTLLIDLDPQTHASIGLGLKPDHLTASIYNVLSDRSDQKQFIENIIRPFSANFDVAPGHVLLSTIEQEFVEKDQAVGKLKQVLESMAFPYEYIILDCPPSLGFLTFNALFAADIALVPIELGSFALFGVAKLLSMIELIRVKMQYAPRVFALMTMVDLRSRFAKDMMSRVRDAFRDNLFDTVIRQNVACRESQQIGVPVREHDTKSRAAADYDALAAEIVQKLGEGATRRSELLDPFARTAARSRVRDFSFQTSTARQVFLVGDFNNWRLDESSKLWDQGKGTWQKRLILEPGRYRYKFVVDGRWMADPANTLAEPNPFGGIDSVIEIE